MENLRASQSMVDYFKKEQEAILKDENSANKEESKQQTLEEASEYYAHNYFDMHETNNYKALKQGFEAGAKWQSEQIGKSEFLQKLRATISDAEARRLIFETFKNK